ncbi:MAG: ribonuclease III [Lentihominibacter sp.]
MNDREILEEKVKHRFRDRKLLDTALTHSSRACETGSGIMSNERLEFLGDAFLDAIIGEELYRIFPQKEEGFLSRIRATLVCEKSLACVAKEIGLGEYVMLGVGEEKSGGRKRESILADTMEAIIGAVYLDAGYEAAKAMVLKLFADAIEDAKRGKYAITDFKTELQEVLQAQGIRDIRYTTVGESGPDHCKTFTANLVVNGEAVTEGSGKSKKEAEQNAAEEALTGIYNVL